MALDKFIRPVHAAGVFGNFYALGALGSVGFVILGARELLAFLAFATGFARRFSYAAVLLLYAVSTLAAWKQKLHPHDGANLLFLSAKPMLAACLVL